MSTRSVGNPRRGDGEMVAAGRFEPSPALPPDGAEGNPAFLEAERRILELEAENRALKAAGLAALSICESLLLSLTENKIIKAAEATAILEDAANAHREAAPLMDGDSGADRHAQVAALIDHFIAHGDSVRYADRSEEPSAWLRQ